MPPLRLATESNGERLKTKLSHHVAPEAGGSASLEGTQDRYRFQSLKKKGYCGITLLLYYCRL